MEPSANAPAVTVVTVTPESQTQNPIPEPATDLTAAVVTGVALERATQAAETAAAAESTADVAAAVAPGTNQSLQTPSDRPSTGENQPTKLQARHLTSEQEGERGNA